MLRLVFDNLSEDSSIVIPNAMNIPHSGYPELYSYLYYYYDNTQYEVLSTEDSVYDSFYIVTLYYFDFSIDYFSYLSDMVINRLRNKQMKLLLYYREPDSPYDIQRRLLLLCEQYGISAFSVVFISGNSMASKLSNFVYFNDFICLHKFQTRYRDIPEISNSIKEKRFTLLSRVWKSWRADFIYNLWCLDLHKDAYVSCSKAPENADDENDFHPFKRSIDFDNTILTADTLDVNQHNDHSNIVYEHFTNSYVNVVLETFIDCEDTGGVFITEKTWKPIRNGQMFIIVGCAGSLRHLKELGFKTFDGIIDESYDDITDVRYKWNCALREVKKIARMSTSELHELYMKALPILQHNQQLFQTIQQSQLEKLVTDLNAIS